MEQEKKTLHVISHSHWDREWYMPFEAHRFKLVEFFDTLLATLDADPSFRSFHLDGQAIVLEDYLEIRPEMREKIEKYIAEDRLVIGPWYILQDEFLVDGESNLRNMLIGRAVSAEYGRVSDTGYFPDAFGNIGQAPQILRGFGIDTVAFGRGTSPRRGDRFDTGEENYGKWVTEVLWRSPDGSEVIGTTFLRWYNNANEIPSDPEEAAKRLAEIRDSVAACSVTPHLLLLNGCDHQPVQTDIGRILEAVRPGFPDELIHSNYRDYFDAIRPYKDRFGIFVGELDGEYGDGWNTLANTASARIYLKQLNSRCEHMLEGRIEPLSVLSHLYAGDEVRRDYFRYLWKTLLKNHPHDSICGCSVDPVHREMVSRFEKVLAAGHEVEKAETEAFTASVDTASTGAEYAVTVFNPHGFAASEPVTFFLDLPEDAEVPAEKIAVCDGGKRLPCAVKPLGLTFDYILPKDRFRVPFYVQRYEVTFTAENVPALGWKTFALRTDAEKAELTGLTVYRRGMMNARLKVSFAPDGSVTVTDRKTRASYVTGIFEDTGDIGDEYVYVQAKDGIRVSTEGKRAEIASSVTPYAAVFTVTHKMKIPAKLPDTDASPASRERREEGRRIGETALTVRAEYTLRPGSGRLEVKTVIENDAENHRLVVLTKNGIRTETLLAEGQFDIAERVIKPWKGWKNPTKPGKMTTFFGLEDAEKGLLLPTRGLCEYEVLRDGANTMSLTLHRGVDRLGDWGEFPTPEAQCKGTLTVEYALIPYAGTENRADRDRAVNGAYAFAAGQPAAFCAPTHPGTVPAEGVPFGFSGRGLVVSALKMAEAEGSSGVILRVFNPHSEETRMKLDLGDRFKAAYEVNLAEQRQRRIPVRNGKCSLKVGKKKIVTVELVPEE